MLLPTPTTSIELPQTNTLFFSPFYKFLVGSGEFQDALHHRPNAVEDLVDRGVAHVGRGGDQLVLLVNVALGHALAHVFAAQLVDGVGRVGGARIPEERRGKSWPFREKKYPLLSMCVYIFIYLV